MSDMYNTIYIVDLVKNEIVSVVAEEVSDLKRPDNLGADEQFKRLFELDSTEAFKDLVLEFADLSTLRDRMGNKNNIACEYVSKTRGWCRLRFFAMDYVEGQPVDRVVFTLQIIDSEKKEMDAIEEKVTKIEKEKKEMNAFLQIISREIIAPIEDTIKIEQRIIDESTDDKIKNYATQSKHAIYILGKLLGDVVEYSKLDTGDIHITETEYSFNDIIAEVEAELKRESDESQITFSKNIAQNVPDKLYGDAKHIKQCLSILLLSTAEVIKNGDIKLSVFAKEHDGKVHLLMSVRDNGPKTKLESQLLRDKLVNGILKLMGSELHNLDHDSDGNETYFEIEQVVRG
jgi:signal transduction histidine kinase